LLELQQEAVLRLGGRDGSFVVSSVRAIRGRQMRGVGAYSIDQDGEGRWWLRLGNGRVPLDAVVWRLGMVRVGTRV
jgi:hypothetical protein